jgi:hypothetical protein
MIQPIQTQMNNDRIRGNEILEIWFSSDAWTGICNDGKSDDPDSMELMEDVNDALQSIIWHVQNNSGGDRIQYELGYFVRLCQDFDVPLWS